MCISIMYQANNYTNNSTEVFQKLFYAGCIVLGNYIKAYNLHYKCTVVYY